MAGGNGQAGQSVTSRVLAILDFGFLGIHEMTVAAMVLVHSLYGRSAFRSYFNGCSTGGRQGPTAATPTPSDSNRLAGRRSDSGG